MMNSTTDGDAFAENPFQSHPGNNADVFFDATPTPDPLQNRQQPRQQQQQQFQQPPLQQQQFQQPGGFAPQPAPAGGIFPPPSGPMDNMAPNQQAAPQMQQPVARSWWANCMMCLTLDTYKVFFDIDAEDIVTRIKGVMLHFYKPEHFRNNILGVQKTDATKGPDLYGPFWITTTLIFLIGVTANMHHYLYRNDVDEFDYDINHLLRAASVLCTFSYILPSIFWVTTQCLNMQALMLVEWVCLYGYSLVPFLPAVVICIIPLSIISWVFLLLATLVSGSLIVRNVAAPMMTSDVGQAKAPPLILAILGTHVIFFLFLKFTFYHHKSSSK